MRRTSCFPILVGLAVLLAGGVAHGVWTDRWRSNQELVEATERVASLPAAVGEWKSVPYEQEADAIALAGAAEHYSRTFTDPETGEPVVVTLLVGRAARMVVHRPEYCYQAVGYELDGAPYRMTVQPEGLPAAEFFTGVFTREEASGPSQLRIFWSFGSHDGWAAPSNPRLSFARHKVLYKLYVLRAVNGTSVPLKEDPCVRLLEQLLPVFHRDL